MVKLFYIKGKQPSDDYLWKTLKIYSHFFPLSTESTTLEWYIKFSLLATTRSDKINKSLHI